MGNITELQSRHYFGIAADMASIPAACRCAGDLYTQTDIKATYVYDGAVWQGPVPADWITPAMLKTDSVETLKIKDLNVTKAKAELGFGRYVARRAAAPDLQVGGFTTDGTWKVDGLDLSGIVPAGATGVVISVLVNDDAASSTFHVRPNATDTANDHQVWIQVANISHKDNFTMPIDADRLLDYYGSNLAFVTIDLTVVGWFI